MGYPPDIEPPFEMTLTFADGTSRTQWCNARLWNLYRGTSVGPYVLQSFLMALERWLLEFAEARPLELDAILLQILKRSDSAALTAVVASVATAFPHASGETLLVLLRSPPCVLLDRRRLLNESQAPSRLSDLLPQLDARNKVYEEERKEADAHPHRQHDLETAIANLQLGPLAPRVHQILDQHRAEMPPIEEQDEDARIWRLAMHRMDLRQYTIAEDTVEIPIAPEGRTSPEGSQRYIRLDLKEPEPDVKEMVDQSAAQFQVMNARVSLLMWGLKVFAREEGAAYNPDQWQQRLQEARAARGGHDNGDEHDLGRGGPGIVAAVCVRDHWEEMADDEQDWCVGVVCSAVEREGNLWNQLARVQQFNMSPDRSCAYVLPSLFGKVFAEAQGPRIRRALVIALTHAINEVRWYAALGIGRYLWAIDRDLILRCVNALATEATLVQRTVDAEISCLYAGQRQLDEIEAEAAAIVRRQFFEASDIANNAYQEMDSTTWFGAEADRRILTILGQAPTEVIAIAGFERLAHAIVGWWDADDDQRQNDDEWRHDRDYESEAALTDLLENFLLRATTADAIRIIKPIVNAIDRHPDKVCRLLIGLIGVEDRQPNTPQFWLLWEQFAGGVRRATWLARIDDEYASGSEMVSAIFLGTRWKENVRHWRSLEGHAEHIHALFEDLPTSSTALDDYVCFLYHVGEQSLPEAFISIAKRLQQGDAWQMLRKGNTIFLLEVMLQRYVYGKPLELKRRSDLREAVLYLLDLLVENGSSAAFRMRDDFVTPVSIT